MPADFRVISIGTLAANPLWDEKIEVRTGHATTTLITAGNVNIIVNPSLPGTILAARLSERTRMRPEAITHVFVTTFAEDHYRGLLLFEGARWLVHEPEQLSASAALGEQLEHARALRDAELIGIASGHLDLLGRCRGADDRIAPGIDLFPLPGLTPGTCGLLVSQPTATVLLCGDAIATIEHLRQGKVLPTCMDVKEAQESFREAIEIADIIVPGRDNLVYNPIRAVV